MRDMGRSSILLRRSSYADRSERGSAFRTTLAMGILVVVAVSIALFVGPRSGPPGTFDESRVRPSEGESPPTVDSPGQEPSPLAGPSRSRAESAPDIWEEEGSSALTITAFGWGTIEGSVVSASGVPIAGAKVSGVIPSATFSSDGDREVDVEAAVTDEMGVFELVLPAGERYDLRVEVPRRPRLQRGRFAVFDEEVTRAGELRMSVGASIRGSVTDPTGAPIANATVSTQLAGPELREVSSDIAGQYELAGLPVGGVVIRAEAEGFEGFRTGYLPLKEEGEEQDLSIVLHPAGSIKGVVVNEAGHSLAATMYFERTGSRQDAWTTDGGRFEIHSLRRGEPHSMMAWSQGYDPMTREVIPSATPRDLVITMKRAPGVMAVIRDARDGSVIEDAEVQVVDSYGANRFAFRRSGNEPPGHIWVTIRQVGMWVLQATAPGYEMGSSKPITTDGQVAGGLIEIRLAPELPAPIIHGIVVDQGDPVSGAKVGYFANDYPKYAVLYGVPTKSPGLVVRDLVATDAAGRFELASDRIPEGLDLGVVAEGFVLHRTPWAKLLGTSEEQPLVLSLDRGATVRGVVTQAGKLVRDHPVVMWNPEVGNSVVRTVVDGTFEIRGVEPGAWYLAPGNIYEREFSAHNSARVESLVSAHQPTPTYIGAGEEHVVALEIQEFGASIVGTVRIDGEPRMSLCAMLQKHGIDAAGNEQVLWSREAWTSASGGFVLTGIPAGDVELSITSSRRTAIYWSRTFSLGARGERALEIDIDSAELIGTVRRARDGKPSLGGVSVRVAGKTAGYGQIGVDGSYRVRDLPVGRAKVMVVTDDLGSSIYDIQLKPGLNERDIQLWPAGSLEVVLPMVPALGSSLEWRVERDSLLVTGGRLMWSSTTDTFQIGGVSPGRVEVKVSVVTHPDREVEGDVGANHEFVGRGEVLSQREISIRVEAQNH